MTDGKHRSLLMEFALGGSSTATACIFTNPLEVVKTVMQAQGELGAKKVYKNSFECGWKYVFPIPIRPFDGTSVTER